MEEVENTNVKVETNSNLSEWVGPACMLADPLASVRKVNTAAVSDRLAWCDRLFSIGELECTPNGIEIGPSVTSDGYYNLMMAFSAIEVLRYALKKYFAVSWDSVEVRFTVTDPKNLVGGLHVGWWPYLDYHDEAVPATMAVNFGSTLFKQNLYNGPYTELMLFGMSQDVSITIPWTYKYEMLPTDDLWRFCNVNLQSQKPFVGSPVLWWSMLPGSAYTTSVQQNARLNVFFKFKGLKWYGPTNQILTPYTSRVIQKQSGVAGAAVVAETVAALAAAEGVSTVTDNVLGTMLGHEDVDESAVDGTYELPTAVQLAYLGDTASCGYPNTTPVFKKVRRSKNKQTPTVSEMLKRPQYITHITSGDSQPAYFSNDPMSFEWSSTEASSPIYNKAHYFRWFGMNNRFWRGTVLAHIIVSGHPMVQVQLDARVTYSHYKQNPDECQVMSDVYRHLSTFGGSKHVIIPLPYLTPLDYMPIYDRYPSTPTETRVHTRLSVKVEVISSMLDIEPTIPAYIYMSAGPDFAFYQPYPPGIYRVLELGKKDKVIQKQVKLPLEPEIGSTRYTITTDPGTMVSMPTVYDYMKLWSRCIPFDYYEDEEPVPEAGTGLSCASWFTPTARTRDEDSLNSWYQTLDYVALLSLPYLYYKGSLAFKIAVITDPDLRPQGGYIFAALGGADADQYRQKTHTEFGYSYIQVPPIANFGTGTIITPGDKQPVLEGSIPYRGSNVWSFVNHNAYYQPSETVVGLPNAKVDHNIVLVSTSGILADAMFRKIGPDYALDLETNLPPPTMWIARGSDWENPARETKVRGRKRK